MPKLLIHILIAVLALVIPGGLVATVLCTAMWDHRAQMRRWTMVWSIKAKKFMPLIDYMKRAIRCRAPPHSA